MLQALSQWRGYGPDGGVCLCFETEEFCSFTEKQDRKYRLNLSPMPITYVKSPSEISSHTWQDFARSWIENKDQGKGVKKSLDGLFAVYAKKAPYFKHYGFRKKSEHRLTLTFHHENQREIKNRQCGNAGALFLLMHSRKNFPFPSKLIVGPGVNAHETANQPRVWLKSKNIVIAVEVSATPYRTQGFLSCF